MTTAPHDIESTTIALITGANRGLGFATARLLGRAGVHVLVGARDDAKGSAAAERLRSEGMAADPVTIDVDSEASVEDAAKQVERDHGRIDVLINNAGILPEATATEAERPLDLQLFASTFRTNLFGAVSVTKSFLPLLLRSGSGRIVNVSSTVGSLADQSDPASPYYGLVVPAYQTSKAALNGLTIALSKALATTPVKVNSVCPGWVQTDLGGPDNRAAAPTPADEAAQIICRAAMLPADGPSGTFIDAAGVVPW